MGLCIHYTGKIRQVSTLKDMILEVEEHCKAIAGLSEKL